MFGLVKANLKIERAIKLCQTDLGLDPFYLLGGRTSSMASEWRNQLRELDKLMNFTDQELALTIASPFAYVLKDSHLAHQAVERIKFWANLGVVRDDVAEQFLNEMEHGSLTGE